MQIQASSCVTNSNYDTVKNVEIQDVCGNKGESFKYDSIKILSPSLLRNTAEFGWFNSNISPAKTEISNNEKSREYSKDNLQKLFEDFQNSIIDNKKSNIKSFASSSDNSVTNYYEEYMKKFKEKFNFDDSYVSELKLDISEDSKITHNTEQQSEKQLLVPIKHQFSIKIPSKSTANVQSSKLEFSKWNRDNSIQKALLSAMVLKDFVERNPGWKQALNNFIFN